jgi:hypothetical protein
VRGVATRHTKLADHSFAAELCSANFGVTEAAKFVGFIPEFGFAAGGLKQLTLMADLSFTKLS